MISQAFPISLVFPPQGHYTQPYLALPCIQAFLKANDFLDVETIDASVESYDHFLSRSYLERTRERALERNPLSRFEDMGELPFAEMDAFRSAAETAVSADLVVQEIEAAKRVMRSSDFYDPELYIPAVRTLYHGLRLVSAAHSPCVLTPHNFSLGYANDRSSEVLAATEDCGQNPYIEYFEEQLLPRLLKRRPRVVGLSVIYGSQLIPALTLGRLLKRHLPDVHLTAGGGFLAYIGRKLMNAPGMEECLDSVVFFEGERPMLELARALREGRSIDQVPCLMWFDRSKGAVRAIENATGHPIKLDAAPTPDFSDLPFDKYFSPELTLPYDINRGCYYGECTFCTLPTVIGPGYRTREASSIAAQTVEMRDLYGATNFNYITDCMPPGMIRDLPTELIARKANVHWWSDARVEPRAYTSKGAKLLYDSGCRKLLFGFETPTPRLLKMMKKGQSARATLDVARNCSEAGISVTFYAMVGFPTETLAEARDTVNFIVDNRDVVREVSLQTFHIDEVAETYHRPEDFGLTILDDPEADLQLYHDYEAAEGMTQNEAAEAFEEMMTALRANLPLFAGDNVYYFMQKSHYFLHLARGMSPEEFSARAEKRVRERRERRAHAGLRVPANLHTMRLPFSYGEVVRTLSHPLARAIRPDFLTGRFVAGAKEEAARALGSVHARASVLAYAGGAAEFCELRPDGERALAALARAGTLGELQESLPDPADREAIGAFAARLFRSGLLSCPSTAPLPT